MRALLLWSGLAVAASREAWLDANQTCGAECIYPGDGECDDGGPGSEYMSCDCGSDCSGMHPPTPPAMLPPPLLRSPLRSARSVTYASGRLWSTASRSQRPNSLHQPGSLPSAALTTAALVASAVAATALTAAIAAAVTTTALTPAKPCANASTTTLAPSAPALANVPGGRATSAAVTDASAAQMAAVAPAVAGAFSSARGPAALVTADLAAWTSPQSATQPAPPADAVAAATGSIAACPPAIRPLFRQPG